MVVVEGSAGVCRANSNRTHTILSNINKIASVVVLGRLLPLLHACNLSPCFVLAPEFKNFIMRYCLILFVLGSCVAADCTVFLGNLAAVAAAAN